MDEINEMSDASANAMVQAMLQSWKRTMDENETLRAEVRRLRAIEEATREVAANEVRDIDTIEPINKPKRGGKKK